MYVHSMWTALEFEHGTSTMFTTFDGMGWVINTPRDLCKPATTDKRSDALMQHVRTEVSNGRIDTVGTLLGQKPSYGYLLKEQYDIGTDVGNITVTFQWLDPWFNMWYDGRKYKIDMQTYTECKDCIETQQFTRLIEILEEVKNNVR